MLHRLLWTPAFAGVTTTRGLNGLHADLAFQSSLAGSAAAAPSLEPVDKVSFGCFGDAGFISRLSALQGRDQLVVAGIESHICVAQTVLGALEKRYEVHVAGDAVGSRQPSNRDVGLRRMERAGAVVSSAEMAVYELLGKSDGTAFKEMLPFLKG